MIINDEISIKAFYRAIEFISKLCGCGLNHDRFKAIIFDKFKAETIEEIKLKQFADSYLFLLNNLNQMISLQLLDNAYFLLTGKKETDKNKLLLEQIYKYIDCPIHNYVALVHLFIVEHFEFRFTEYAFMISNFLLLKINRNPLIPYYANYENYKERIKSKDVKALSLFFYSIERKISNHKYPSISKEDIIEVIKPYRNEIKNTFNVEKLFLFGSIANGDVLPTSDIDFIVIFDETLINEEQQRCYFELFEFLTEKFKRPIDILNYQNALKNFDMSDMENMITLI